MRHPHGLRAAASAGIDLPSIGDAFQGGFYAGLISHTANGSATHALIVAPAATGASGTGYTITTLRAWKTTNTTTIGTTSTFNGSVNSTAMNNASHPAAQFCENLTIGGFTDWYLPARDELEIAYSNFKPDTTLNSTSSGINNYSVPKRSGNYGSTLPSQTSILAFQTGGAQAFVAGVHWTSTEIAFDTAYLQTFTSGTQAANPKNVTNRVRAFRKIVL